MDITITPGKLSGTVSAIPSKSMAHRYLICAAFASGSTELICPDTSQDIEATAACLNALGADIRRTCTGYHITPIRTVPGTAILPCGESGSTLRFLLPIAGALGVDAIFELEGRLSQRPLSPLWEEMERMGCRLSRPTPSTLRCRGKLSGGSYRIDGGISSQFITGLMLALPLLGDESTLTVSGKLESKPYVTMTEQAQSLFGPPGTASPGVLHVEGDWSNGAFWLAAKALGNPLSIENLNPDSMQGDRAALSLIPVLNSHTQIDASDIPDLVPILSVVAAASKGAVFTNIRRLRLKESDRVATVIEMLTALGGRADATGNTLTIYGTGLTGGIVDAHGDHRIAMSAAIAATVCTEPVTVLGAEAVKKSYPKFWEEYKRLSCHCEPVRRLVWQSPESSDHSCYEGNSHASVSTCSE